MESNDSPEIPDREETSDIPGLPSGEKVEEWPPCFIYKLKQSNRAKKLIDS